MCLLLSSVSIAGPRAEKKAQVGSSVYHEGITALGMVFMGWGRIECPVAGEAHPISSVQIIWV